MAESYRNHHIETNKKREKFWGARTVHDKREITRFGSTEGEAVEAVKQALDEILSPQQGAKP